MPVVARFVRSLMYVKHVLLKLASFGVTSGFWSVIADLITNGALFVNCSFSEPWSEQAGVRQGSVLGSLLFKLLFDGVAGAVRAACPGAAPSIGPNAPRVTCCCTLTTSSSLLTTP